MRIVSLLPGATDSLFFLGLGERVVAVTHECDLPPEASGTPRVTRSNLELDGLDGGAIDARVTSAAAEGLELYAVDTEMIRALEPDLVVAQDVCAVCAVGPGPVEEALPGVPVLRQHPHSLEDVLVGIEELAMACGVAGEPPVARLRRRVAEAAEAAAARAPVRGVFLEWLDPPFPAGHWTPDLLTLTHIEDPLAGPGKPSVPVSWQAVVAARPEVLVLAPCGLDEARARVEANRMAEELGRVRASRVLVFDGSRYFNRPGPRLVDSLERLSAAVHSAANPPPPGEGEDTTFG